MSLQTLLQMLVMCNGNNKYHHSKIVKNTFVAMTLHFAHTQQSSRTHCTPCTYTLRHYTSTLTLVARFLHPSPTPCILHPTPPPPTADLSHPLSRWPGCWVWRAPHQWSCGGWCWSRCWSLLPGLQPCNSPSIRTRVWSATANLPLAASLSTGKNSQFAFALILDSLLHIYTFPLNINSFR